MGWAQKNLKDSLTGKTDIEKMNVYGKLCTKYSANFNDSIYQIGDLILDLDLPNDQQVVYYYTLMFHHENLKNNPDKALELLEKGLSLRPDFPNANFDRLILGKVQSLQDNFQFYEAVTLLNEILLPLEERIKNNTLQDNDLEKYSLCLNTMSGIYSVSQDYDRALKYDLKADSLELKNVIHLILIKLNISENYKQIGNLDLALSYAKEAMQIAQKEQTSMYSWTCAKTADVYNQMNEIDSAVMYINIARDPTLDTNTYAEYPSNEIRVIEGAIRLRQGLYDKAIDACYYVYLSASENNDFSDIEKSCKCLSEAYKNKGEISKSLRFAEFQIRAKDSIQAHFKEIQQCSFEASEVIAQNAFNLELAQKSQEILMQKQQEKLDSNRSKMFLLLLILILLLMLLVALLLYLKARRKREFENEKSLKEKEVLLQEVHHRVKNNFQIIISIINLQTYELEDQKQISSLRQIQNRISAMSIVHQLVYDESDFSSVSMAEYFNQLVPQLGLYYFENQDMLDYQVDANSVNCTLEQAIPVGLLSNEILTNCFKFGRSADGQCKIHISMEQKENQLELRIKDEGSGIIVTEDAKGEIGFEIVSVLTDQLDGKTSVSESDGREIIVSFPVQKKRQLREL